MKNLITVILFALLACLPAEAGFVPNAYDQTNTAGVDARVQSFVGSNSTTFVQDQIANSHTNAPSLSVGSAATANAVNPTNTSVVQYANPINYYSVTNGLTNTAVFGTYTPTNYAGVWTWNANWLATNFALTVQTGAWVTASGGVTCYSPSPLPTNQRGWWFYVTPLAGGTNGFTHHGRGNGGTATPLITLTNVNSGSGSFTLAWNISTNSVTNTFPKTVIGTLSLPVGAWDGQGVISPVGIANGGSIFFNGGAEYGPDSINYNTGSNSTTSGINEFIFDHPNDVVHLGEGTYIVTDTINCNNQIICSGFQNTIIQNQSTNSPIIYFTGTINRGISGATITSTVNDHKTYVAFSPAQSLFVTDCWFEPWAALTNGAFVPLWETSGGIPDNESIGITMGFNYGPAQVQRCWFLNLACGADMYADGPLFKDNGIEYMSGTNSWPTNSPYASGAAVIFEASQNNHAEIEDNYFGLTTVAYLLVPPVNSIATNNFMSIDDQFESVVVGVELNTNQFWTFKNPRIFAGVGLTYWGRIYDSISYSPSDPTTTTLYPGGNSSQITVDDDRNGYTSRGRTFGGTVVSTNAVGFVGTFVGNGSGLTNVPSSSVTVDTTMSSTPTVNANGQTNYSLSVTNYPVKASWSILTNNLVNGVMYSNSLSQRAIIIGRYVSTMSSPAIGGYCFVSVSGGRDGNNKTNNYQVKGASGFVAMMPVFQPVNAGEVFQFVDNTAAGSGYITNCDLIY